MRIKSILLVTFAFFVTFFGVSQSKFEFVNTDKQSVKVPFTLVNNLVVIKADVNGKELSFLLDTGIVNTILFNLKFSDSLNLHDVEKTQLQGLGDGLPIQALKSKNNHFKLKGISSDNHVMYIITDNMFDLSAKMGMDIHGIIGGDLFDDFIVKINYATKKLTFYKAGSYNYKSCKNCETFPLEFFKRKPFINVFVQNNKGKDIEVKLLIDSGGGDALWLFENTHPDIIIPDKYFEDYLGKGLNGDIYGKKSRVSSMRLGSFTFHDILVAFPDSIFIETAVQSNKKRNGTFGAEMLKRFHVIFDYPNKSITLKKNKKSYNNPFSYNKSGIEIIYGGEMLVKEAKSTYVNSNTDQVQSNNIKDIVYSYSLAYKPSYEIAFIRENSPAKDAGLQIGDIILEINGMPAYNKDMDEIIFILSGKQNKKIKILVNRGGLHIKHEFALKDML